MASGTPIPAICDNPQCGHVFFVTSFIGIGVGGSAHLEGNKIGPCPKCRGSATVPGGLYRNTGTQILVEPLSTADRAMLEKALALVKQAVAKQMPVAEFQKAAEEQVPGLSALWRLTPTNKNEAYAFLTLVIGAIGILLVAYQTLKPSEPIQVLLPPEIVDAILSSRHDSRADNRKEQRPPESPQVPPCMP